PTPLGDQTAYSYVFRGGMARLTSDKLSLGVSGMVLREALADASANTVALNGGAQYALPYHPLRGNYRLGLSILNLGPGLKFVSERDPLPRKIKFGAAGTRLTDRPLNVAFDITNPNDNSLYVSFGAEYWFKDLLAL